VQHLVLVMAGSLLDRVLIQAIPVVPKAIVRPLARPYIAGPRLPDALATIRELEAAGRTATVDVLGEQLTSREQIVSLVSEYRAALEAFAREGMAATLSLKMTALGLKLDPGFCAENVRSIVEDARRRSLAVELDMEDSTTTSATIDIYRRLRADGYDNVVLALQAYMRRTRDDVRALLPLTPRVRLVKGIWIEPASVVYTDYDAIRESYARLLDELFGGGAFVAIASHDEWIHWQALDAIDRHGRGADEYEFQMLLGVRAHLGDALVERGHRVRVYVPYGEDWHAYSVRRFKENPRLARHVAADIVTRARRRGGR
jgi:proline dehydrogenase